MLSRITAKSGYRRDIDGLRAISILSVLLFHAGFRFLPGGFVGVDIFFVISGYLIASHIVAELDQGSFSLANFYERRVRRIAPALLAMLAITSIIAYFVLLPSQMLDFQRSLLAALGSVSNVYFWITSNYWSATDQPLLHTWSLAIEEQFYLFLPLGLMLIYRWKRGWLPLALIFLTVVSFLLSALCVRHYPDATFYLLPYRAWELLLGSLFGLGIVRCPRGRTGREIFAALGLLMTVSMLIYKPAGWLFPGPSMLLPCLGAALLLGTGAQGSTFVSTLLSFPPLVGIGLISYSTYLWHEPLICYQRDLTWLVLGRVASRLFPLLSYAQAITVEHITLVATLSLLLGYLSWKYVEQPFRFGARRPKRSQLFGLTGAAALTIFATSVIVIATKGLPNRFSPEVLAITSYSAPAMHMEDGICFPGSYPEFSRQHCRALATDRPNWLLIGDSLAGHLDYGLNKEFPEVNIVHFSIHGCKPVLTEHFGEHPDCQEAYRKLYTLYLPNHHFDKVIMAANWQPYDLPRITSALQDLKRLHQNPIVVGPIMHYDAPLRFLLADSIRHRDPSLPERHRVLSFDDFDETMAEQARDVWNVPYFSYRILCPNRHCRVWAKKDVPLQWDDIHLMDPGSVIVAEFMHQTKFLDPSL